MTRGVEAILPRRLLLLAAADALLIGAILAVTSLALGRLRLTAPVSLLPIALASVVVLACLHCFDLYESRIAANSTEVATRLSQVLGTACVVLAGVYYADPHLLLQRDVILAATLMMGSALVASRRLFRAINHSPAFGHRVLLLGTATLGTTLAYEFMRHPELGIHPVGFVGRTSEAGEGCEPALPRLGEIADLPAAVQRSHADRVIVTLAEGERLPLETLVELRSHGVRVERGAEAYEDATAKVPLDAISLGWLLSLDMRAPRLSAVYKRGLSLLVAVPALVAALPVMAVVAILIRMESPGPVIFRQARVGQGGRHFTVYKFRSMFHNADRGGAALPCQAGDSRVTRLGRWLRRCRLDELPQLFNVIRGDIALVGPRPFVPEQESELVERIPFYRYRWAVKPGLTGWAQIHRGYCSTIADNTDKLAYDLFYIKHDSLSLDLLILFQTLKIMILGRGAR